MGFPNESQQRQAFAQQAAAKQAFGMAGTGERFDSNPADRMPFVRKVYLTLAGGLAVGGVGAYVGAQNAGYLLGSGIFSSLAWINLGLMVATLFLRKVKVVNLVLFGLFNFIFGMSAGIYQPILASQGQGYVFWQAIGTAVAVFGGLTAYAFATRKDFSFMRGLLFTTCWGLFFLSLGNWGLGLSLHTSMLYQGIGLMMVCGFILYDTSNVLLRYDDEDYVAAALELAWDFWYLVIQLIQIFADRD